MSIGSPQRTTRFTAGGGATIEDVHAMRDRLQALATDWPEFQKCNFAYDPDGSGGELPSDNGTLIAQKVYVIGNGCKVMEASAFATSITSGFLGAWTGAAATPASISTPRMRWTQVDANEALSTHVAPSSGMFRWDLIQVRIDETAEAVEARAFQDAVDGPFTSQDLSPGISSVCEIIVKQGVESASASDPPNISLDSGCRELAVVRFDDSGIAEIRDLTIPFGENCRVRQLATEGWFQFSSATVDPVVNVPSNLAVGTDPVYYPVPPGLRDPSALLVGLILRGGTGLVTGITCELGRLRPSGWTALASLSIVANSYAYLNLTTGGSNRIPCWGNSTASRAFFGNPVDDNGILALRVAAQSGDIPLVTLTWQFKR